MKNTAPARGAIRRTITCGWEWIWTESVVKAGDWPRAFTRNEPRLVSGCQDVEAVLRTLVRQVVANRARQTEVILSCLRLFITLLDQQLDAGTPADGLAEPRLPYSHGVQKAVDYLNQDAQRRLPSADLRRLQRRGALRIFALSFVGR